MMKNEYDVVIIGGGVSGMTALRNCPLQETADAIYPM